MPHLWGEHLSPCYPGRINFSSFFLPNLANHLHENLSRLEWWSALPGNPFSMVRSPFLAAPTFLHITRSRRVNQSTCERSWLRQRVQLFFYQINAEVACQLSELESHTSPVLKRIPLFIWTITPKGFGAKLTFAKASGFVTGDAPVSYWPIFPLSPVTVPEVFANATLETRKKLSRVNFRKGVWDCYWGRAGQR